MLDSETGTVNWEICSSQQKEIRTDRYAAGSNNNRILTAGTAYYVQLAATRTWNWQIRSRNLELTDMQQELRTGRYAAGSNRKGELTDMLQELHTDRYEAGSNRKWKLTDMQQPAAGIAYWQICNRQQQGLGTDRWRSSQQLELRTDRYMQQSAAGTGNWHICSRQQKKLGTKSYVADRDRNCIPTYMQQTATGYWQICPEPAVRWLAEGGGVGAKVSKHSWIYPSRGSTLFKEACIDINSMMSTPKHSKNTFHSVDNCLFGPLHSEIC